MKKKSPKDEEHILIKKIKQAAETGDYFIVPHARQRCKERDVSAMDIEHVLEHGRRMKIRDRFDEDYQRWSYALEGKNLDGEKLRVIVILIEKIGIVTVVLFGESYEK